MSKLTLESLREGSLFTFFGRKKKYKKWATSRWSIYYHPINDKTRKFTMDRDVALFKRVVKTTRK